MHAIAGKGRQFEEGPAGIEQPLDALARRKLAALGEARRPGGRIVADRLLQPPHLGKLLRHRLRIGPEGRTGGIERGSEGLHQRRPRPGAPPGGHSLRGT